VITKLYDLVTLGLNICSFLFLHGRWIYYLNKHLLDMDPMTGGKWHEILADHERQLYLEAGRKLIRKIFVEGSKHRGAEADHTKYDARARGMRR
jgi:hypothetical protein